jgi:MOSC domain-containing protein YiiM
MTWGAGPAETAAAALADALRAHGTGANARVLASGEVSAGLTSQSAQAVGGSPHLPTDHHARQATRRRARLQGRRHPPEARLYGRTPTL